MDSESTATAGLGIGVVLDLALFGVSVHGAITAASPWLLAASWAGILITGSYAAYVAAVFAWYAIIKRRLREYL